MAKDCIGREIEVGDFVFTNNLIYEVLKLNSHQLSLFLANSSPTTKKKMQYSRECCLIPKEDYLLYKLRS